MKIEGWCGWDLVAEVEVAFERLRSSLRHRRRWPSLKTYRWRRCETVGQDSSSQRWPARLLRHSGDKPIPLLLLRPACFLSFLIWKRLIETSNCDTPSASFFSRKKDDNQFFTCLFFQQQKRSVFTQSPVSLAIVVASLLHQNRIKSSLFSEERVMIRVILFTRFFQFRFRRMLKKIPLCKRNVEEGKKTLLHTNIRPLVQFDSPKLNFSSCHGCSSVAVYVSFAEWVGVYKKKGDGSSRFGIFFNHFLWCHGSVDDIVGLPTALVHTRPFQIEKAAHLQLGKGCNLPPCLSKREVYFSSFSQKASTGGRRKHVTLREARSWVWTVTYNICVGRIFSPVIPLSVITGGINQLNVACLFMGASPLPWY